MQFPAGTHTIMWDGYDEGKNLPASRDVVQNLISPGEYHVRGLINPGLKLIYDSSIYYSGFGTPWKNMQGTGAWLADHAVPAGIAFLPANAGSPYSAEPQIMLTSYVAETGHDLVWVSANSLKTLQADNYWGWEGGNALAADMGKNPVRDVYAYILYGKADTLHIRAFRRFSPADPKSDNKLNRRTEIVQYKVKNKMPREPVQIGLSLAAYDGIVAVSIPLDGTLLFVDAAKKKIAGTYPAENPRGVAFDQAGRLYYISQNQVFSARINRATGANNGPVSASLSDQKIVINHDLEEPYALAVDDQGQILVSDRGKSHQVKIFSPSGEFRLAIGAPGGPQIGPYDDRRMHYPAGIAVDQKRRLWVAESDILPKRVSMWDLDTGKLIHAWYGPPHYGGGGTVDPENPNRIFYSEFGGLIEFEVDHTTGASHIAAIPVRHDISSWGVFVGIDRPPYMLGHVPERPVRYQGRTYLTGFWQGSLRGNESSAIYLYDESSKTARPVAYVGGDRWWPALKRDPEIQDKIARAIGPQRGQYMLAWSDLNNDGKYSADELSIYQFPGTQTVLAKRGGQTSPQPVYGLNLFSASKDLSQNGPWGINVPAPTIRPDGVPIYDLNKASIAYPPPPELAAAETGRIPVPANDGWSISLEPYNPVARGVFGHREGKIVWSFMPESYPSRPGLMVHPTRLLGPAFVPDRGQSGAVWAINGEKGAMFLLTSDGLFLQTIGGDMRTTPMLRFAEAKPGTDMSYASFEDEHFHPTITQARDGKVYLVAGKEHSSVFRIEGWEQIRRIDLGTIKVESSSLASLPPTRTKQEKRQGRAVNSVLITANAPKTDGNISDWPAANWVDISGQAKAALCISGEKLFAAYQTDDPQLLANAGSDWQQLFHSGGSLDLQLATRVEVFAQENDRRKRFVSQAGDIRLLVTRVNGTTRAILYRPVVPGAPAANKKTFVSPIGTAEFDSVTDISSYVQLGQKDGNYEFSVPLSVLGFAPKPGEKYIGDIGVLKGNGRQVIRRMYWNNINTELVSDIPSEARQEPALWGVFEFSDSSGSQTRPQNGQNKQK